MELNCHTFRFVVILFALAVACGSTELGVGADVHVRIEPEALALLPGEAGHFSAIVVGASDTSVAWSVREGPAGGSISADGLYRAPFFPGTFHVVATSSSRTVSAAALIVVNGTSGVSVAVSPLSVTVAAHSMTQFVANVDGDSDTSVRWSADSGTIRQDGMWTAPETSGSFQITARSVKDPTKAAVATATVSAPPITITIDPAEVMLSAGGPGFQFKAHVTGSPDTAVTWSIQEPPGTALIDATGVFIPPQDERVCFVLATSHADPSKTATAVVTVAEDLIDYGGPVMPTTRTFALWWGDPRVFPSDAQAALEKMLRGVDGSAYLAIADQYMRGGRATTSFAGSLFDVSAPPGPQTDTSIVEGACRALEANGITPLDGDLIFVNTSNFPSGVEYCGAHSWMTCHGRTVLLAYIPNPAGSMCDSGVDLCNSGLSIPTLSLLFTASHELMETITDPFNTAWHGRTSWEVADRCGILACVALFTGTFEMSPLYSNAKHACVVP